MFPSKKKWPFIVFESHHQESMICESNEKLSSSTDGNLDNPASLKTTVPSSWGGDELEDRSKSAKNLLCVRKHCAKVCGWGRIRCWGNITKNKIFQPRNPLYRGNRERKHLNYWLSVKPEDDARQRQSPKRLQRLQRILPP